MDITADAIIRFWKPIRERIISNVKPKANAIDTNYRSFKICKLISTQEWLKVDFSGGDNLNPWPCHPSLYAC